MKLAVMQPYIFPYIGYFQMIHAVDKFILLDDVNFINKGWINRNRILINNQEYTFTLPLKEASQNKLIHQLSLDENVNSRKKLLKTIEMSYKKAPQFAQVFSLIQEILNNEELQLAKFILHSFRELNEYLGINTPLAESSQIELEDRLKGQQKIIEICKKEKASHYINAIGGRELYEEQLFLKNNIKLNFIQSHKIEYEQFSAAFVPHLSIIDVMMFNPVEKINAYLNEYDLV